MTTDKPAPKTIVVVTAHNRDTGESKSKTVYDTTPAKVIEMLINAINGKKVASNRDREKAVA